MRIVLIGSQSEGETTIGQMLGRRLGPLNVPLEGFDLAEERLHVSCPARPSTFERLGQIPGRYQDVLRALAEGWVRSEGNARLATAALYTAGRTPEKTCDEASAIVTGGR